MRGSGKRADHVGPCSGSYVHDPLLAPISYCTHVYRPPSIRLAAVAAFQTRHGIDAPDASEVGKGKKENGKKMWGNVGVCPSVMYTREMETLLRYHSRVLNPCILPVSLSRKLHSYAINPLLTIELKLQRGSIKCARD